MIKIKKKLPRVSRELDQLGSPYTAGRNINLYSNLEDYFAVSTTPEDTFSTTQQVYF